MAQFYSAHNNGVVALIRKDDAEKYGRLEAAGSDPFKDPYIKVFVFCRMDRRERNPEDGRIFAGDLDFMEQLCAGHRVDVNHSSLTGWSGFVPFSNQEHRMNPDGDWKKYLTTPRDLVEKFELLK